MGTRSEISHLVPAKPPSDDQTPEEKEHTRMYWDERNGQDSGRKGTCQICSKKRKLFQFNNYYYRCSGCLGLDPEDAKQRARGEGRAERKKRAQKARLAYPCIGGPLDGEHATTEDFVRRVVARRDMGSWKEGDIIEEGGLYGHLAGQYTEFNAAHRGSKRIGGSPTMVFIHASKLLPLKAPRDR